LQTFTRGRWITQSEGTGYFPANITTCFNFRGNPIMKRTKFRKTTDEIVAYLLQIAGDRKSAERAAEEWAVRIRVIQELSSQGETFAVCPAEDVTKIRDWHANSVERLRAGGPTIPGDLMRIEQPPDDVDTDFSGEPRREGQHSGRPLKITNPREIEWDKL
jgi:hypothetical protein